MNDEKFVNAGKKYDEMKSRLEGGIDKEIKGIKEKIKELEDDSKKNPKNDAMSNEKIEVYTNKINELTIEKVGLPAKIKNYVEVQNELYKNPSFTNLVVNQRDSWDHRHHDHYAVLKPKDDKPFTYTP